MTRCETGNFMYNVIFCLFTHIMTLEKKYLIDFERKYQTDVKKKENYITGQNVGIDIKLYKELKECVYRERNHDE